MYLNVIVSNAVDDRLSRKLGRIPTAKSEAINRRTDNTMAKNKDKKTTNGTQSKTHKLTIDQHEPK